MILLLFAASNVYRVFTSAAQQSAAQRMREQPFTLDSHDFAWFRVCTVVCQYVHNCTD